MCGSHDVKYGSGSGQQSVTGTGQQEDVNSHWLVKGPEEGDHCARCSSAPPYLLLPTGRVHRAC